MERTHILVFKRLLLLMLLIDHARGDRHLRIQFVTGLGLPAAVEIQGVQTASFVVDLV